MFATEFQGGLQGIEVLSPAGKNPPTRLLKINGSPGLITKDYERDIKGFKYSLTGRGSQSSSIQCPSATKDSLALTQALLVLQLKSAFQEDPLNLEVVVLDSGGQRRRFLFSTTFRSMDVNSLHAQIPWVQSSRDVWTNVVFNLQHLTQQCFSAKFASIDSFLLRPVCSLRKIFTLPVALLQPTSAEGEDSGLVIPVVFDFPMGSISTTFFFSLKKPSTSSARQVVAPSLPGSELQVSALQIRSRKVSNATRKVDASPLRSGSATSRSKGPNLAACPEENAMMRSETLVAAGTRALSAGCNRTAQVDVSALKSSALTNLNTRKEKALIPKNDKISADEAQIDELSKLLTAGIDSRIEDPRSSTMQPSSSMKISDSLQNSRPLSSRSSPRVALELELELKDEKNVYDFSNFPTDQRQSITSRQREQPITRNITDSRPGTASSGVSSMRQTSRPNSARQNSEHGIHQTGGVSDRPSLVSSMSLPGDAFGINSSQVEQSYQSRDRVVGASHEEFTVHRPISKTVLQPVPHQMQQSQTGPASQTLPIGDEDDQEDSCDLPISVFSWSDRYYPKAVHDNGGMFGSNMADYNRNLGGLYGSAENLITDDVLRGSLTRASVTSIITSSDNYDNIPVKVENNELKEILASVPLSVHTANVPYKGHKSPIEDIPIGSAQTGGVLRSFKEEELRAMSLLSQLTNGYDREADDTLDLRADTDTDPSTNTYTNTGPVAAGLLPLRSLSSASTIVGPTHLEPVPSIADIDSEDEAHTPPHVLKVNTTTVQHLQPRTLDTISPELQPSRDDIFSPLIQPRIDNTFSPLATITRRVDASVMNSGGKGPYGSDDSAGDEVQGPDPSPKLIALTSQLQSVLAVLTSKERIFIEEFGERCFKAIR